MVARWIKKISSCCIWIITIPLFVFVVIILFLAIALDKDSSYDKITRKLNGK